MLKSIKAVLKDEEGATLVEYALMVALIAAVCVAIVQSLGTKANTAFTTVDTAMP
ncbi:MAG TPA: Flp family type IVb pilin [Armatimonadota bacterium]|nr:Flp family type IVb pilin [Armatimonadota bacterium]HOM72537.1 Flp family type IVb pilin [Armatimonadota bacterium]HPP75508.1 Flp family type IVb pilin [Armatimonadota bacterium]